MELTATRRRFSERAVTRGRVDRSAGMIRGVKVLGSKSRNGRTYTSLAMERAVPLYDGKKIFINHPTRERMGDDRSLHDWVGVLRNPRFQSSAIFADIELATKSPHYEAVLEFAEKFHGAFGLSHIATGESHYDGDEEIVESITDVFSVDLVTDPATAAGLFESVDDLGEPVYDLKGRKNPLDGKSLHRELTADAKDAAKSRAAKDSKWRAGAAGGAGNDSTLSRIRELIALTNELVDDIEAAGAVGDEESTETSVEESASRWSRTENMSGNKWHSEPMGPMPTPPRFC